MNQRVQEAQKKREEQIASEKEELDKSVSSSKERLSAAEERRTSMLREAQEKAAAEVAKVGVREISCYHDGMLVLMNGVGWDDRGLIVIVG